MAVVSAVLVAPLVEEFLFRLLLQGWLERVESRLRRTSPLRRLLCRVPVGLRGMLRGLVPRAGRIALICTLHYRKGGARIEPPVIEAMLVLNMVVGLFTLAFGLFLLKSLGPRPKMSDLGFSPKCSGATCGSASDVPGHRHADLPAARGCLSRLLKNVLEWNIAADPSAIALFAVVLGTLYYRTHRIVPSVVLPACA